VAGTLLFGGSQTLGVIQWEGLPPVTDRPTAASGFALELDVAGITSSDPFVDFTMSVVVSRFADPAANTVGNYRLDPCITATIASGTTGPLVVQAGFTGTDIQKVAASAFNRAWQATYRDSNGALARTLIVVFSLTGGTIQLTAAASTLTVIEQSTRTGVSGSQYVVDRTTGEATGFIECTRSGRWVPANEAVRDGYTGALVHASEWDPPEPKPRRARRSNQWAR
jgi:hypothetical protein